MDLKFSNLFYALVLVGLLDSTIFLSHDMGDIPLRASLKNITSDLLDFFFSLSLRADR